MKFRRVMIMVGFFLLAFPGSAAGEQTGYLSPQCPRTPAGMEYFARGADFHFGRNGTAPSASRAEAYYEKALRLGDSAAALNLGKLYQSLSLHRQDEFNRLSLAVRLAEQAVVMGCPDGYLALANAYSLSFSPLRDEEKARAYWKIAAEHGSITAKGTYGDHLYSLGRQNRDPELQARGLAMMEEALAEGNGHAAPDLAEAYRQEGRAGDMVEALRQGARLGSKRSLYTLRYVYLGETWYGQPRYEDKAGRVDALYDAIDDYDPVKPIPDFDKLVPPGPVRPIRKK